jgi:Fe-S-cluster containining protein
MSVDTVPAPDDANSSVTAQIKLTGPRWGLEFKLTVPAGPTTLKELLPIVRTLSDAVVNAAVQEVEELGAKISCSKGCGACCRQLVPIAEVEARRLAELVQSLPEPRQSQVRARFADALRRLKKAGILGKLHDPQRWYREGYVPFGMEYFRLGIACPFLEDESCSIHPDRPLTCREFLVTTPAIHCQSPSAETVKSVRLPLRVGKALAEFEVIESTPKLVRWVPLVLALEWGATHPDPHAERTGLEVFGQFMQNLTGKQASATPASGGDGSVSPDATLMGPS